MPKSQLWNKQICLPYGRLQEKKIQKALRLKTSTELDSVSSSVLYVPSTFFCIYCFIETFFFVLYGYNSFLCFA